MTLQDLFDVLDNQNAVVTVNDHDNTQIVKFYLAGSSQLVAELLARNVSKFSAKNANEYVVTLTEST